MDDKTKIVICTNSRYPKFNKSLIKLLTESLWNISIALKKYEFSTNKKESKEELDKLICNFKKKFPDSDEVSDTVRGELFLETVKEVAKKKNISLITTDKGSNISFLDEVRKVFSDNKKGDNDNKLIIQIQDEKKYKSVAGSRLQSFNTAIKMDCDVVLFIEGEKPNNIIPTLTRLTSIDLKKYDMGIIGRSEVLFKNTWPIYQYITETYLNNMLNENLKNKNLIDQEDFPDWLNGTRFVTNKAFKYFSEQALKYWRDSSTYADYSRYLINPYVEGLKHGKSVFFDKIASNYSLNQGTLESIYIYTYLKKRFMQFKRIGEDILHLFNLPEIGILNHIIEVKKELRSKDFFYHEGCIKRNPIPIA